MADVIDFVQKFVDKRKGEIKKLDELAQNQPDNNQKLVLLLAHSTEKMLDTLGIDTRTTDEAVRDFAYVMNAFTSLVYRSQDIPHPFHPMVDKTIEVHRDEEGNVMNIEWKETVDPQQE